MHDIADTIRQFVHSHLVAFDADTKLADDDNFFELGLVDSPFAIQLVAFLEERFQIRVGDQELDVANFNSINRITSYVQSKRTQ